MREYLELLDEVQMTSPSTYHFDEKWISHPYEGTPVINPDGSIYEEYIKRQDEDGRDNLELVNKHFDEEHELYSLDKVIVDERQLDIVDKATDVMDKLLRVPEVQEVVRYYLEQKRGFFAVKPDRHGKELIVKTPEGAEIPGNLRISEERLMKAISNVKSYEKGSNLKLDMNSWLRKWYEHRLDAAEAGGFAAYFLEFLAHPEWKDDGMIYIENILYKFANTDFSGLKSTGYELLERGYEFLPTKEGMAVVSTAAALYFGPKLIMSWKRRRGERMNRGVDEGNVLDILLEG